MIARFSDPRQSSRRLNYDLQVLCDHVRSHSITKVILAFHDSETFDGALLNDIVEVIRSGSLHFHSPVTADFLKLVARQNTVCLPLRHKDLCRALSREATTDDDTPVAWCAVRSGSS